jgi:hypothetical protein
MAAEFAAGVAPSVMTSEINVRLYKPACGANNIVSSQS